MVVRFQIRSERKRRARAVTALEYALIGAAIAAAVSSTVFVLGITVNHLFDHVWDALRNHSPHFWSG